MADRELTSELRHRQQQRRTTTTILVVLLALFFAFWYAYSYYRDSTRVAAPSSTEVTCTPFDPKAPAPGNTTVNVYNATSKNGLAGRTAADVERRGFKVGTVANDPLNRKVTGPAEVRFGPKGKSRAPLVVPLGGKGTKQVADKRKDATVDLVLGETFSKLGPAPTPTGTPMCPSPSTEPTASSSGAPSSSASSSSAG